MDASQLFGPAPNASPTAPLHAAGPPVTLSAEPDAFVSLLNSLLNEIVQQEGSTPGTLQKLMQPQNRMQSKTPASGSGQKESGPRTKPGNDRGSQANATRTNPAPYAALDQVAIPSVSINLIHADAAAPAVSENSASVNDALREDAPSLPSPPAESTDAGISRLAIGSDMTHGSGIAFGLRITAGSEGLPSGAAAKVVLGSGATIVLADRNDALAADTANSSHDVLSNENPNQAQNGAISVASARAGLTQLVAEALDEKPSSTVNLENFAGARVPAESAAARTPVEPNTLAAFDPPSEAGASADEEAQAAGGRSVLPKTGVYAMPSSLVARGTMEDPPVTSRVDASRNDSVAPAAPRLNAAPPATQPVLSKSSESGDSLRPVPVVLPNGSRGEAPPDGSAEEPKDSASDAAASHGSLVAAMHGQGLSSAGPSASSTTSSSSASFVAQPPEPAGSPDSGDAPVAAHQVPAPEIANDVAINAAVHPQPAREITLRLTADDAGTVDVQLREKAGQVQVAVRTDDPQLTKSLQNDLGDLVGRLENKGYRTEVWAPVAGRAAVSEPAQAGAGGGQPQHWGSASGQQQKQEEKNQPNQRQQPKWVAELEETLSNENERIENA